MADGAAEACVCILFYGDEDRHFKLAQRVLNEPMRKLAERNVHFRFGCNAVGTATSDFLVQQIAEHFHNAVLFYSKENIMKYPMMRLMFHSPPIKAPVTIWFDHDSYLESHADDGVDWLDRVLKQFYCCDMQGSVYKAQLSEEQAAWAEEQPWFDARPARPYLSYALGGWWAIKTEILQKWNWPPADLQQKNGDRLLGTLFEQQALKLCHFRGGVCVNANDAGVEASVPRTIT
jgi:hypothetical protein